MANRILSGAHRASNLTDFILAVYRRGIPICSRHFTTSNKSAVAEESASQTHFGFESVKESEKEDKVYEVFQNVASKYDLMNDVMSGGIHRLWKDHFMEVLGPSPGDKLIDVAGGTGDIAFRFLDYVGQQQSASDFSIPVQDNVYMEGESSSSSESEEGSLHNQSSVTVCDINQAMLDVGMERAEKQGRLAGLQWLQGNAECLPVGDEEFDAYTIAFGIRNCTHVDKVIYEAHRVLKPGGRFLCLEFSYVANPILRRLYDSYSFQVIPVMGQIIAGDWKSYQYLVESIRNFPKQEEFASMIREAGFKAVTYENLQQGVAAIHSGFKL